ncbi:MAG: helix-turn-helix domain-containing protein [Pseudomonadota bacterium]
MKVLDIGEVSERSGVAPSALRYYEKIGLISPIGRRGLRRQYDPTVLTQLSLIALGRTAGFSLDEIREMFGADLRFGLPRPELQRKADELEGQIRKLSTLSRLLRHVAECPAPSHLECPKFQKLMRLALRRSAPRAA